MQGLESLQLDDKRVFLRLDLNVPLSPDGKIIDSTRIEQSLPTIRYILERTRFLCIASHLGRPRGQKNQSMSLAPVGEYLANELKKEVVFVTDYHLEPADQVLRQISPGQFVLLENLRFNPGEEKNERDFSQSLAKGVQIYIDDAFGAVHREHASVVGVPKLLPPENCGIGPLIRKEIEALNKLNKPSVPFVVVMGGSKVSDKINVILSLIKKCTDIIIGGAMAYTFLAYSGKKTGKSLVNKDQFDLVETILNSAQERRVRIHLPVDHVGATSIDKDAKAVSIPSENIPDDLAALDIGTKSVTNFCNVLKTARTVLWNGPLGVYEWSQFSHGTEQVAKQISKLQGYTVVGGGDSVAVINRLKLADKFSHVSTGGGASLEYLQGTHLPGLKVLQ